MRAAEGLRPYGGDVVVMGALLLPSLAQVLLDPIAGRWIGVAFAIGSVAPVAWRRTAPSLAALAGSAAWLIPTTGFLFLGYVVAVILFYSVGAYVASRPRLVAVTAFGCVAGTVTTLLGPEEPVQVLVALLAVVGPVISGRVVARQRAQTEELRRLTLELARERARAEQVAVAEERTRIARELHDVVGHEVTLIAVQAEAAGAALRLAPDRATQPVEAIRSTAHRTLTEMRAILGVLREGEQASRDGHPEGLDALCRRADAMGVPTTLSIVGSDISDDAAVALALNRIVKEALTNAGRHAPEQPVSVEVTWGERCVDVWVRNPLCGLLRAERVEGGGLGIPGMAQRARLLGGTLTAGTTSDGRLFEVFAQLPFQPES